MQKSNVLIVHWHDLGRHLGAYGHTDVRSPRLDQLAAEGILLTRAHATAPLCSPSRGSLFTGRYPQSNGLVGLAHHGWEYRAGVRTLPAVLSESGWHTALFGMQHETSYPSRLGFDEFDVSNSYCEYVVEQADDWLRRAPAELVRPVPAHRGILRDAPPLPARPLRTRRPGLGEPARVPAGHPRDPPGPRRLLRLDHRRRRRRRTAAGHPGRDRAGPQHLGGVHDRPRPGAAAGQVHAVRRGHRHRDDRAPADRGGRAAAGLRRTVQRGRPGAHAAGPARSPGARRGRGAVPRGQFRRAPRRRLFRCAPRCTSTKTYHDSFDPIRAIRTKEFSLYRELRGTTIVGSALGYRRQRSGRGRRPECAQPAPGAGALRPPDRPGRIAQPVRHPAYCGNRRRLPANSRCN